MSEYYKNKLFSISQSLASTSRKYGPNLSYHNNDVSINYNSSDSDFGNKKINIFYNPPAPKLYREELNNPNSNLTSTGAISVLSGAKTGRSPKDKRIVKDNNTIDIWWDKNSPNIELIISFADTEQGHHGGIYQATNWIYTGKTTAKNLLFFFKNRWVHNRTIREMLGSAKFSKAKRECWFKTKETSEKHRYLMPLKNRKKYEKLSKPYPKRTKHSSDAPTIPSGRGQCDSDLCAPIK